MLSIQELEGRTVYPFTRLLELEPLAPVFAGFKDSLGQALDTVYYTDAYWEFSQQGMQAAATVILDGELALGFPGLDDIKLVIGSQQGVTGFQLEAQATLEPLLTQYRLELFDLGLSLRISADLLKPVKPGTREPDPDKPFVDITLGTLDFTLDENGPDLDFDFNGLDLPPCLLGDTGILLSFSQVSWLSPATDPDKLPANTPADFTGLYLADLKLSLPDLPGTFEVRNAFIGTGGFTGTVAETDLKLEWDVDHKKLTGDLVGDLGGFQAGLKEVSLEFQQSALVGCSITGDIYVPYLEKRIGLDFGISGVGGFTAAAGLPFSTSVRDDGTAAVAPSDPQFLAMVKLGEFLEMDLASFKLEIPTHGPAAIEVSGQAVLAISGRSAPISFQALRIDSDGNVDIKGGWIDLAHQALISFNGFSFEISKIGFGATDDGRQWIGLNGGLHLAQGLPLGASVEGLKISWDPKAANIMDSLGVSLAGIALELTVPNVFSFLGEVSFFDEVQDNVPVKGFRGHIKLSLIPVKVTVDAELVVGKTAAGVTFFYFYLGVDLPTGIPLFTTGAGIFGFQGLIANNMAPNKKPDDPWYYGWYLHDPKGATSGKKWSYENGAFAVGLGTTIGTNTDDGFVIHVRVLLVLVLPGPRILLEGKGNFIKQRGDSTMEGAFEALLALDFCAQTFQFNLAVTFEIKDLLKAHAGADIAFAWGPTPPAGWWHVFLGEKDPEERRCGAELLSIVKGYSYFQLWRDRLLLGAGIGIKDEWTYGPVRAWVEISLNGEADVRFMIVPPGPDRAIQFDAFLELIGAAGLDVFGIGIQIELNARAAAKGPSPWYLYIKVHLAIKINLLIKTFEWSADLPLSWGDENQPQPLPVLPIVDTISWEHPKVIEEAGDSPIRLEGAFLPPDGRPVVIFKRPVRDLASLGAPGIPNLEAEKVGSRKFSYQLRHMVLVRTDPGEKLVAASGVLNVTRGVATLPGVSSLPPAAGASLEILNLTTLKVVANQNGTLTLSDTLPDGNYAYRLKTPVPEVQVAILAAQIDGGGTAKVTLSADPSLTEDISGGELRAGGGKWVVYRHQGKEVIVQNTGNLPPTGAAMLAGAQPAELQGVWLPAADQDPAATKFMLFAKTPFTYFRHNTRDVAERFDLHNPDYACGPQAVEERICVNFDDVALGKLSGSFATEHLTGDASGNVAVESDPKKPSDHQLVIGGRNQTGGGGRVALKFDPAVEHVWVYLSTLEAADVEVWYQGSLVETRHASSRHGEVQEFEFVTAVDQAVVRGALTTWYTVCFLPGWTCVNFASASFPQNTTGRQTYAGVDLETTGIMQVPNDTLIVTAPPVIVSGSGTQPVFTLDDLIPKWEGHVFQVLPKLPKIPVPIPNVKVPWPELALACEAEGLTVPGVGPVQVSPDRLRLELPALDSQTRPAKMLAAGKSVKAVKVVKAAKPGKLVKGDTTIKGRAVIGLDPVVVGPFKPPQKLPMAILTIYLPQPVTRVRLDLTGTATATAYAGQTSMDSATCSGAGALMLRARSGWIDRVVVMTVLELGVKRICYDAGLFGWQRYEQWSWRMSTLNSIQAFYQEDPVFSPGRYRLDVLTAWDDEADNAPAQADAVASAHFTVGAPPGVTPDVDPAVKRYPGGPLRDLKRYVAQTVPENGGRPFYRTYDLGLLFNETYITRMFLDAKAPLQVAVSDGAGRELRPGAPVIWGRGHSLNLSQEEEVWTKTLHNDGSRQCASIDMNQVVRDEALTAGGGELLAAAVLHRAVLQADNQEVYAFEFTTSRYAGFAHHLATFDGQCRSLTPAGGVQAATWLAAAGSAAAVLAQAVAAYQAARTTINQDKPSAADYEAYHRAEEAVKAARNNLPLVQQQGFETAWAALGLANIAALPGQVEVSSLPGALLVASPEPLHWERVALSAGRSTAVPMRLADIHFDVDFGAPDLGDFDYQGVSWHTNLELAVKDQEVAPRLSDPWMMTMKLNQATRVEMDIRLAAGGSARLKGTGTGIAPDATAQGGAQGQTTTLAVSGASLQSVELSGTGISLLAVRYTQPFVPVLPTGPLRIKTSVLPVNTADVYHRVDLISYADADLAGWQVRVYSAKRPGPAALYRTFTAGTLKEARIARIYGGVANGRTDAGVDLYFGGGGGVPPADGAVFQLLDPQSVVRHEIAILPQSDFAPEAILGVLPNADGTKAFVFPAGGTTRAGYWQLDLRFAWQADADLPVYSVGGNSQTGEQGSLRFGVC